MQFAHSGLICHGRFREHQDCSTWSCNCVLVSTEHLACQCQLLRMQNMARKVLHGITQLHSSTRFNGVHLRMANDAVGDWAVSMRGRARMYQMYKQHMIAAGFDASTLVYVASGMLKSSTSGDPHPRDFLQRMAHDLVLSKVRFVRS